MKPLLPEQKTALNKFLHEKGEQLYSSGNIGTYYRVQKEGQTFFSALYTRVQRRNSYTVAYAPQTMQKFGCIELFLQYNNSLLALIRPLEVLNQFHNLLSVPQDTKEEIKAPLQNNVRAMGDTFTMTMSCTRTSDLEVVELCQVKRKCVFVECGDGNMYISAIPNFIECD